jgi:hypothetical protein
MGTGDLFPGGKAQPGRDADHSPHLLPRSRMSRRYTSSLSLGAGMAWRNSFTLLLQEIYSSLFATPFDTL